MKSRLFLVVALLVCSCSCSRNEDTRKPVVISLLGIKYYEPLRPADVQARLDSNLASAKAAWTESPIMENYVWYGRRIAYLSRFQEAIDVYTEGIKQYPQSAQLYRHRGHRYISMRKFDEAITDLKKARSLLPVTPLDVELDGEPNIYNVPISTTQFNILYHLGIAYYLKGDFTSAAYTFNKCLEETCVNHDLTVACVNWLYMSYRRNGELQEAALVLKKIKDFADIIENESAYVKCKMYQGTISTDSLLRVNAKPRDATIAMAVNGYEVGNWFLYNGEGKNAFKIFEKVLEGDNFAAFGFIAAEAEIARQK